MVDATASSEIFGAAHEGPHAAKLACGLNLPVFRGPHTHKRADFSRIMHRFGQLTKLIKKYNLKVMLGLQLYFSWR